ncbi:uncharacterized protein [Erythrolamprus reginae]|uniref:uncharacterized protein n=1 Tax=Erythrolamprus reginae TaxID=121349 RepID=UPI00396C8DCA
MSGESRGSVQKPAKTLGSAILPQGRGQQQQPFLPLMTKQLRGNFPGNSPVITTGAVSTMDDKPNTEKASSPVVSKEKAKGKDKERSKPSQSPASVASLKEAEKRIKALEKKLEAALHPSPSPVPLTQRHSTTPEPGTPQSAFGHLGPLQEGDWSPEGQFMALPQAPSPALSWTRPEPSGIPRRGTQAPSATFTPTAAGLRSQTGSWQHLPPDLQEMFANVYAQGVNAGTGQQVNRPQTQARNLWPVPPPSGLGSLSEDPDFGGDSDKEYEFSEDENTPEQQPVAGLFKPTLFRTLLFKAKQVMDLQGAAKTPEAEAGKTSASLLREPQPESDHIPASHIFVEGVKKPWQHPAAAQGPSNLERKFYTFDEEVEKLLEFPPIDQPVVTLVSSALVPSETGESLKPEDRKAETLLRKTHQMAGWGFRAAAAASFFNRASIMWLQELQSRLGPEEARLRQDISKLQAAAEFSADATLHAAKFIRSSLRTRTRGRSSLSPIDARTVALLPTRDDRTHVGTLLPDRDKRREVFNRTNIPSNHSGVIAGPTRIAPEVSSSPGGPFGEATRGDIVVPNDSPGPLPLGGKLQHFSPSWLLTSSDKWVLATVSEGLRLEFIGPPPHRFVSCPRLRDLHKRQQIRKEIAHLLDIRAIEQVPRQEVGKGFYSRIFLVPKTSGGYRMILNLKQLNIYIKYRRFHMHSLQTILPSIRSRDLLTSIDLKEAYLHVPVHPAHREFLRFCSEGVHYQYRAMPFGLSSAPRTFTKLLDALTANLRSHSIRLMAYLDDIIILSRSPGQAREDLARTIRTLEAHGFTINVGKSQLFPATRLQHLGSIIDTISGKVTLSPERQENIHRLVSDLIRLRRAPLALLSKVLGTLVSAIGIVPWARYHIRGLQWFLLPAQRARVSHSQRIIILPKRVRESLKWWLTGQWTMEELASVNINFLELRAVFLALLAFAPIVEGKHILILTDNVATRAHLNHQGGTRSQRLMEETMRLFNWAETHLASLTAEHIAGISNSTADWLSRATLDPSEWRLHPDLFYQLTQRFGVPLVDLFASSQNTQLPRFFTRFPDPRAEGTNALLSSWPPGLLYAFPPVNLIPRVVEKILHEEAEVILLAPYWPRRPWFADLVELSVSPPWRIPDQIISLSQGNLKHPDPQWLHLTGWHLKGIN